MTSIKFRALTHNDHKLFFEALGEYGKDFQNIQQYIAQKGGKTAATTTTTTSNNKTAESNKSSDPQERREQDKKEEDKKREQIRNFYNKLYAKLSQLIGKLDDRVEKVNQELYLLINYGEVWKKLGFKFNNKTKKLLEELVYQGSTTLRFKSKNVRLRTPPCKALKKIHEIGIDEKVKVVTMRELPKDVIVELHPSTNRDWLKVQSMSQNPRVRAKLSIQKRLSNLLEFLENKWNISQDKLNRTVDVWLKVTPNSLLVDDLQPQQQHLIQPNNNNSLQNGNLNNLPVQGRLESQLSNSGDQPNVSASNIYHRIRLKPSSRHELKEVNITRVIPDNHLDLSFNAYLSRLGENKSQTTGEQAVASGKNFAHKDSLGGLDHQMHNASDDMNIMNNINHENNELSQGPIESRLPISLTTPDCSILFERSCTSDQPSIVKTRKHLNLLQSELHSLEGCENSRTTCDDTQDRSLMTQLTKYTNSCRQDGFSSRTVLDSDSNQHQRNSTILINNNIPALHDEDATLPVSSAPHTIAIEPPPLINISSQLSIDSHNSRSVDFHIPKGVTLGDFFKMAGHDNGGDEANDGFAESNENKTDMLPEDEKDTEGSEPLRNGDDSSPKVQSRDNNMGSARNNNSLIKPLNHMIEIEKLAEGWTRQDESSMTIGELYLAFRCPEKIILEYEFEQFTYDNETPLLNPGDVDIHPANTDQINGIVPTSNPSTKTIQELPSNNIFIFKLLTAASLSLTHIERQKQEQQHKLLDQQSCSKMKRRKGSGQGVTMTLHDIEATNQRVEEALKQLQPTRLSSYRRPLKRGNM